MQTTLPLILILLLFLGGCSSTDPGVRSSVDQKEAPVIGSTDADDDPKRQYFSGQVVFPEPIPVEPALKEFANRSYRVPFISRNKSQRASASIALQNDLKGVIAGEFELSEVTEAFVRFTDGYERALEGTVGYYERGAASASGGGAVADSGAYESAVKLWMAVSGGGYDRAGFERWAVSILEGYRLDLQISDSKTANMNLRQEVESYLW